MKLIISPSDDSEKFEISITRVYERGSINNYGVKHKDYKAFQYDDSDRPSNYTKEKAETISFHGFLIGKKGKPTIECYVKIKYEEAN